MTKIANDEISAISTVDLILRTVVRAISRFVILERTKRMMDAVMKETSTITINTLAHGKE